VVDGNYRGYMRGADRRDGCSNNALMATLLQN